ncbi:unnamed protein product, partial [Trichogramma brassicae]
MDCLFKWANLLCQIFLETFFRLLLVLNCETRYKLASESVVHDRRQPVHQRDVVAYFAARRLSTPLYYDVRRTSMSGYFSEHTQKPLNSERAYLKTPGNCETRYKLASESVVHDRRQPVHQRDVVAYFAARRLSTPLYYDVRRTSMSGYFSEHTQKPLNSERAYLKTPGNCETRYKLASESVVHDRRQPVHQRDVVAYFAARSLTYLSESCSMSSASWSGTAWWMTYVRARRVQRQVIVSCPIRHSIQVFTEPSDLDIEVPGFTRAAGVLDQQDPLRSNPRSLHHRPVHTSAMKNSFVYVATDLSDTSLPANFQAEIERVLKNVDMTNDKMLEKMFELMNRLMNKVEGLCTSVKELDLRVSEQEAKSSTPSISPIKEDFGELYYESCYVKATSSGDIEGVDDLASCSETRRSSSLTDLLRRQRNFSWRLCVPVCGGEIVDLISVGPAGPTHQPHGDFDVEIGRLSEDLNAVADWAGDNHLSLNAAKTKVMILGSKYFIDQLDAITTTKVQIHGTELPYSSEVKSLGVWLHSNLDWGNHVDRVARRIQGGEKRALRQCRRALSPSIRKDLVESLVFPHLDYACVVYNDLFDYQNLQLQRALNACVRFVVGTIGWRDHVTPHRLQLGDIGVFKKLKPDPCIPSPHISHPPSCPTPARRRHRTTFTQVYPSVETILNFSLCHIIKIYYPYLCSLVLLEGGPNDIRVQRQVIVSCPIRHSIQVFTEPSDLDIEVPGFTRAAGVLDQQDPLRSNPRSLHHRPVHTSAMKNSFVYVATDLSDTSLPANFQAEIERVLKNVDMTNDKMLEKMFELMNRLMNKVEGLCTSVKELDLRVSEQEAKSSTPSISPIKEDFGELYYESCYVKATSSGDIEGVDDLASCSETRRSSSLTD